MRLSKKLKAVSISIVIILVIVLTVGCANNQNTAAATTADAATTAAAATTASGTGLHKLTEQDVLDIYRPTTEAAYQDQNMKEAIPATDMKEIQLTDEEKEKIKGMNLVIGFELDHMADAMAWVKQAVEEQCAELGITLKDSWIASAQDNVSQLEDYQRILAIADNYDAILTLPTDTSTSSPVLKQIMEKTMVGFMLSAPFDLDWNHPNFAGATDIDAYQAGLYSAEAAIKVLNGSGTLGTIGYINGKTGAVQTCTQRYRGWDKVFSENPDVKVVQEWFDNPNDSKAIISSLLAKNPDIKVLLVDWSNPIGDYAQQVFKERGLKPWQDIAMISIDLDGVVMVPMAKDGPDNNYTAGFISQTWYTAGLNMMKLYAKTVLYGDKAPHYVVSPPVPFTTWNSLKTHSLISYPEGYKIPDEIMALNDADQWPLGVENVWK